ncbi:MAG: hypothetical protein COB14_02485 [Alphaproteobacteria bacterium]|nr:MAG: hypothetical protein COB14_02485 [Alphaproteobacteria bacterium]
MFESLTTFEIIILTMTMLSGFLVVYSHVIFPIFLKIQCRKNSQGTVAPALMSDRNLPSITILIPAYNEEYFIADKIINLAALEYPSDKLNVIIYCDGSTDHTALMAQAAMDIESCHNLNMTLIEETNNIGKIAALNKIIPTIKTDIVALSDVSALLSMDALLIAAKHFEASQIGFVGGTYDFADYASAGEEIYWRYQRNVKKGEAVLGAPIGCHGAFYIFRKELFRTLPADTVNDDFILPMEILGQGYKGIYEPEIVALELEQVETNQDFKRRIRIAMGNVQQVFRLLHILHPKHRGVAMSFFSGKVLRAFMPILLMVALLGSFILMHVDNIYIAGFFGMIFVAQIMVYMLALLKPILPQYKIFDVIHYLVSGHVAGLFGLVRYATGQHNGRWERAVLGNTDAHYSPMIVRFSKRTFDILSAIGGLIVLAPLFPILALLIKLDGAGPVIFKQKRVGLSNSNFTSFFWMYKFRTMVVDAEKMTGAVWAKKDDPRITRMGKFMRKTRLDELPQLWNVLIGDMSLIGPRPERPELYGKLEKAVPFFAERNFGVRPGITGPAQIHNGYDETIEDVRNKAAYDHSYALSLSSFKNWIRGDALIFYQTIGVVVGRRGQ